MKNDLSHIDTWLFDLDNTLYPFEAQVMSNVSERMTAFVMRELKLSRDDAFSLQKKYLYEHGTTLAGLMAYHGISPRVFLDDVHDVPLDALLPDPDMPGLLGNLKGRRMVFSNGDEKHVTRLLTHLNLDALFDDVFHLEHADYIPKPQMTTYERMIARLSVKPEATLFFEDSAHNLKPARDLGMVTVLVGPHAQANTDSHVDFRAPSLKAFLEYMPLPVKD